MNPREFIEFLGVLEKLKCNTRHSWTSSGRQESVAEHSWRMATMALLLSEQFSTVDINKVIVMCLVHDWGEALTGDIPTFLKTQKDNRLEDVAVNSLIEMLPEKLKFKALFLEMEEGISDEAKLYKALDKLEVLIQHNEADISTWLPLEHELNLVHGQQQCAEFDYTTILRELVRKDTEEKLAKLDD